MKFLSRVGSLFRGAWNLVCRPFRRKKPESPNIYPLF
tara:strand:+ start:16026 stop:16136 length:111 start_codon:yes stop_codon:yes gene_type:complete